MSSTYLELCNKALRRLNEVEIAQDDFASVRGIQALIKDAIKSSIAKINQAEFKWPFNAAEYTQALVAGQTEYVWPDYFKVADWNSFQLQKNEGLGVGYQTMDYIDREEWYKNYRDADYEAGGSGLGVPTMVFPAHGNGFGVTSSPNAAYSVRFRYFLNYSDLTNYNDVSRIPTTFDTLVVDGAMYHLYMFKDNMEATQAAYGAFEAGLKDLRTLYINTYNSVRDTRINRSRY